jgi:hypothetical protein
MSADQLAPTNVGASLMLNVRYLTARFADLSLAHFRE